MKRITKARLNLLAAQASQVIGKEITLCNAPHYGGWAIETNSGSMRIMERKNAQACESFLQGILYAAGKVYDS